MRISSSNSNIAIKQSADSFRLPRWLEWTIVIVIVLELIAPFSTVSYGPDGPIHFYWIRCYDQIVRAGIFPPRWLSTSFRGFGSPTFYFYPPLSFMVASLLNLSSGIIDSIVLFQGVTFISSVIGAWGIWVLLGNFGASKYQKALGIFIYSFAPYRIAEIYSRSSLSSIFAYSLIPWVFVAILWIFSSNKVTIVRGILTFVFSVAALVLSSLPMAILVGIIVLFLGIVFGKRLTLRILFYFLFACGYVLLLDAFFWLPLYQYRNAIHLNNGISDPEFIVWDALHFSNLPGVFHGAIIYSAIALFILAVVMLRRRNKGLTDCFFLLTRCAIFLSVFVLALDLPISVYLWRYIPLFSLIQGPWRIYTLVVFLFAIWVGTVPDKKIQRWTTTVISIWTVGALLPVLLIIFNVHFYHHHITEEDDPATFLPVSARSSLFSENRPDIFLPLLGSLPTAPCMLKSHDSSSDKCERISSVPNEDVFAINFSRPHEVTFHQFNWPAWKLYKDQTAIPTESDSMGRATAVLPAGKYAVQYRLEPSRVETWSGWISLISLVIASGALLIVFNPISGMNAHRHRVL